MAPALTETQSTSAKFSNSSSSLADCLSLKTFEKTSASPGKGEDPDGMNGHSVSPVPCKTTYSINGLVKNLVKNEFLPISADGPAAMSEDMGRYKSDDILQDDFKTFGHDDLAPENDLGQEEVEELLSTLKPVGFEFEKDFLDCINMSEDVIGLVNAQKETLLADRLENVKKCLHQFHRRKAHLLQRLRKMETLFLGKHVAEEITGVIEFSTGLVESGGQARSSPVKKTLPSMSLFMRQIDHAAEQQANAAARAAAKNFKYFGSGSTQGPNGVRQETSIMPDLPPDTARELDVVARELSAQQRKILQDLDSDATESSSGGESADEMTTYANPHQHPLSM
ncbi:unnamed protein product [Nesidiocoris tenuis]|uniref:Uncharacterized protein n=1 Tax=Nesidiocoris tenuis TaxID=355587 RepID=A0A6H5GAY5_9HEMI|nr:unnamed protein product [Nesidiocoris tenuis]